MGSTLQSLSANALDENNFALMASLDLSATFNVVDIQLLLKRLDIIGIPSNAVSLIKTWLTHRLFYVSIEGEDSYLIASTSVTIQGLIMGPILYAIFVCSLFDLRKMSNYADDNFIVRWNICIKALVVDMQISLESIINCFRQSGLKVNEWKTEMCLFHRNGNRMITICVNNTQIISTPQINFLGVTFDSKLNWNEQVAKTIKKPKKHF